MLFATWNCFAIPFEIAFEPPVASEFPWMFFNSCIDFFFLIDIVITFRTTYINSSGDEVSDPRLIRNQYLKGKFWLDVLATIPFDYFASGSEFLALFGLLKVMRVFRLGRIIDNLNIKDDIKMTLKLAKLIFFLILYIHAVGCFWWYIVKAD